MDALWLLRPSAQPARRLAQRLLEEFQQENQHDAGQNAQRAAHECDLQGTRGHPVAQRHRLADHLQIADVLALALFQARLAHLPRQEVAGVLVFYDRVIELLELTAQRDEGRQVALVLGDQRGVRRH